MSSPSGSIPASDAVDIVALPALLDGWPGPGLTLDAQGRPLVLNAGARLLAERHEGWLLELGRWAATGGPLTEPHRSVPVETGSGPGVVEFTTVLLTEGGVLCLGREVTLERRLRHALTESRQRYKDLVDVSSDFAWEVGPDGRFVFVSAAGAIGYHPDDLIGRHPSEFVLSDFADQPLPFDTGVGIERTEVWLRAKDGAAACLISSAVPLIGPQGDWIGARGACRDITEARVKGMELAQVRLREKYLGYIVSSTRDDVDPGKTLEIAVGVAVNATGAGGARLYARTGDVFSEAAAQLPMPVEIRGAIAAFLERVAEDGEPTTLAVAGHVLLASRTLFRHEVNGAILVWRGDEQDWSDEDLSMVQAIADQVGVAVAQARYQERLKTLSERDGLTGLYNRRTFMEMLETRLDKQTGGGSALLYFDLDNFKAVNDKLGHGAGDDVLRAVGELLGRLARPSDLAGRLGGDEFVLWIDRVDEEQAVAVADRLLREAAEFLRPLSASPEKPLGVSVGVACYRGGSGELAQGLVDRGDQGMYAAKRMGKGHRALAPLLAVG
ncbi:diguanylate cyclase [Niveispirillum sp.]|uniref:sensor domain-containing diguanylate cyclase n=1 Tax=Niveispirillum sp. TaxID=1917217 RepID=UPI0025DBA140|nr:diguanylate cyclase [Niveispirillum sp.]